MSKTTEPGKSHCDFEIDDFSWLPETSSSQDETANGSCFGDAWRLHQTPAVNLSHFHFLFWMAPKKFGSKKPKKDERENALLKSCNGATRLKTTFCFWQSWIFWLYHLTFPFPLERMADALLLVQNQTNEYMLGSNSVSITESSHKTPRTKDSLSASPEITLKTMVKRHI